MNAASATSAPSRPSAAAPPSDDNEYGMGMDLDEWEAETTKPPQPEPAAADSSASSADASSASPLQQPKSEVTIETALTLPLTEIYFTREELQRYAAAAPVPAAVVAALAASSSAASAASASSSSSAVPSFPLRILSERVKGIAFQLWPAAKILCGFMRELQHDLHAADLAPVANYAAAARAKGKATEADAQDDHSASPASPAVAPTPVMKLAPAPMRPLSADSASGLFWPGKRVLELGAGCGLVGMLAATLGAQVTVTDMPAVVAHLQANIDANFGAAAENTEAPSALNAEQLAILHSRCHAAALEWGVPLPTASAAPSSNAASPAASFSPSAFDVILLSDCVYWEDLFAPLVSTLRALSCRDTVIFLCQSPRRPKIERRFYKLAEKSFRLEIVREVAAATEESGEKRDVKLLRMELKA